MEYGTNSLSGGTGYKVTADISSTSPFTISAYNVAHISKIMIDINPIRSITLDDETDNSATLAKYDGATTNTTLHRKLVADKWNTFCVPFDIELADGKINDTEVEARELDKIENNILSFKPTNKLVAGHAYLIKPKNEDVENPVFTNVVIRNEEPEAIGSNGISMIGAYSPVTFDKEECKTTLLINSEGKFFRPTESSKMKGMRAYFVIPQNTSENAMKIIFADDETGIADVHPEEAVSGAKAIYGIDGTYAGCELSNLPKGVYIVGGKKIIK